MSKHKKLPILSPFLMMLDLHYCVAFFNHVEFGSILFRVTQRKRTSRRDEERDRDKGDRDRDS